MIFGYLAPTAYKHAFVPYWWRLLVRVTAHTQAFWEICMSTECNLMYIFHLCLFTDATTENPLTQTPVTAAKSVESEMVEILI